MTPIAAFEFRQKCFYTSVQPQTFNISETAVYFNFHQKTPMSTRIGFGPKLASKLVIALNSEVGTSYV